MTLSDILDMTIFKVDIEDDYIESLSFRSLTHELNLDKRNMNKLLDFVIEMAISGGVKRGEFIYCLSYESAYRNLKEKQHDK